MPDKPWKRHKLCSASLNRPPEQRVRRVVGTFLPGLHQWKANASWWFQPVQNRNAWHHMSSHGSFSFIQISWVSSCFICQLLRQQLSFWTMIALWSQKRSNGHGKTDKLQWSWQITCPTCPKKILYKFKVMKRASREYPWVQSAPQRLQSVSLRP